jgi:putative SbcD/Mre11-related phosphoesterase
MRLVEIAPGRYAHATGALWLPTSRTALIADTHLGYGWAQRRRGDLGPVHDNRSEPKLQALIEELQPRRIIVLGDFVHAPKPAAEEREAVNRAISSLQESAELILIRGNHDRAFATDFNMRIVEEWCEAGIIARHGDRLTHSVPEGAHLILGHFHPVLNFRDAAGARHRLRIFLTNPNLTVLPAFSPFSAGFEINLGLPVGLRRLFGSPPICAVPVTGTRVAKPVVLANARERDYGCE